MPTVNELFSDVVEEVLVIDSSLRTINIPSSVTNLGVESDDETTRLKFQMPRYNDGIDLKDFVVRINYENAGGEGDVYEATDVMANDDTITFSWLVGRFAVMYKGIVKFIVCLKKIDGEGIVDKEFNTTVATLPVLEGLETGEAVIEDYPDAIATTAHEAVLLALGTDLKGDAGYTPVKGVDYFTDEDINELVEEVSNTVKGDYANAYKQTVSGSVIRVDDVSPIEHTVGVKVRSKNLCALTNVNAASSKFSYDESAQTFTINASGFVQYVRTFDEPFPAGTKVAITVQVESGQIDGTLSFGGYHIDPDGSKDWQGYVTVDSGVDLSGKTYTTTFVATDTINHLVLFVDGAATIIEPIVLKAQFELGDEITEYEPYIDPSTMTLTRCGKNFIPFPYDATTQTAFGITFTDNGDGSITVNGTSTDTVLHFLNYSTKPIHLQAGIYTLSGCPAGGGQNLYRISVKTLEEVPVYYTDIGNKQTFTLTEDVDVSLYIAVWKGVTVSNLKFYPQLEVGNTASDYEIGIVNTYTPATNGTVENVYSVSPTMTLFTDTPGVTIEAEYNKDIQKVINEAVTNVGVNLTDTVTGIEYALSVVNGKLTLSEIGG